MKKIFFIIALQPLLTFAQSSGFYNLKLNHDTILINGIKVKGGDTLRLGYGSNFNKDFLFVIEYPTVWNTAVSYGNVYFHYLDHLFANQYMIYGEVITKRYQKKDIDIPVFYINGKKNLRYITDLYSAINAGEIIGINGRLFKDSANNAISQKPAGYKADELKKWKALLDSGAITKEEYDAEKKKILNE